MKHPVVKLFVEGGGETSGLKTACRTGFTSFLIKAGISRRPRVLACGSRQTAYNDFCTAVEKNEAAILLIDSEAQVASDHRQGKPEEWRPWHHLKNRQGDGWSKPSGSSDADCHMMVQSMENWLIADRQILAVFFGQGFRETALPAPTRPIETIAAKDALQSLETATKACKTQKPYGKGENSFKLLEQVDPDKVIAASPWAKRFIDEIKKKCA